MALVKYIAPLTEVRGSVGGVVFSRNSMGTFARIRKKPRYQATNDAQRLSTALAYYTALWGYLLNNAQRVAWNVLAAATVWQNRLGDNYSPTGLNLYVRSNVLLSLAQRSRQDTAPGSADEAAPDFTLDYSAGNGIRITNYDGLASPPVGTLITWYSLVRPLSIYQWSTPWFALRFDLIAGLGAPDIWIASADCVALRRYFFRFRVIRDTGVASAAFFEQQDTPAGL